MTNRISALANALSERRSPTLDSFPTTRRTVVRGVRNPSSHPRCFEQFARDYRAPVVRYIRTVWRHSREEADDLAQEFLTHLIERRPLHCYDPDKGRFRSYLKHAIHFFLRDQCRMRRCQKRGGMFRFVPADETLLAEAPEPQAEEEFDRAWARTLLEKALREVRERLHREGQSVAWTVFDLHELNPPISGELSHREIGERLGRPESEVRSHGKYVLLLLRNAVRRAAGAIVRSQEELLRELRELFRSHTSLPTR